MIMASEGKAVSLQTILRYLGVARSEYGYAIAEAQSSNAPYASELQLTLERIDRDLERFTPLLEKQRALDAQRGAPDICPECSQAFAHCSCPEPTIPLDQIEDAERIKRARRSMAR